jgi:hypothetical protein
MQKGAGIAAKLPSTPSGKSRFGRDDQLTPEQGRLQRNTNFQNAKKEPA